MALPRLDNATARRVFLAAHALAEPPTGPAKGAELLALIRRLGFVQVDSINTVERAHHMILWARRQSYRPENLRPLLERDRVLFEHWTHDAAVIPTEFLPYWQLRFARDHAAIPDRWEGWQGTAFRGKVDAVLAHIRAHGPVGSGDVGGDEARGSGGWWDWHPSKAALEYLWRAGRLAVCRREGFAKIYDLAERVYPACAAPDAAETVDWACRSALERLAFATSGEIAAFWGKISPDEAKAWCASALARGDIAEVLIEGADGRERRCFALPGLAESAAESPDPPDRVRILSPFDPALRDRNRTERLFGFHYRIEVFVPEARRQYGYYVFPVLEGSRLIGRIDLKCRRDESALAIAAFWPEPGIRLSKARLDRIRAELDRLGRFAGCPHLAFADDWIRAAKVL
ncbi:MAG: crosslink repair DNA glycosylase YcaQ family protein [Paracoccaceae bacterium]